MVSSICYDEMLARELLYRFHRSMANKCVFNFAGWEINLYHKRCNTQHPWNERFVQYHTSANIRMTYLMCSSPQTLSCFSWRNFFTLFVPYVWCICPFTKWKRARTHPHTLTYFMQQGPSWEANRFAASQEIPRILWNPKIHYRIHKCQPPVPIMNQLDPVRKSTSRFLKIQLNIYSRSPKWSLSFRFPHQNPVYASPLTHTCHMQHPSHSSWFYNPKNIG